MNQSNSLAFNFWNQLISFLKKLENSRFAHYYMSLGFVFLMTLGWPTLPLPFLLFGGFTCILFLENHFTIHRKKRFFLHLYLTFLIWNLTTTWWVANSTISGGIMAFTANSFLMCIPVMLFRLTKKYIGEKLGYFSLIPYWVCFEYLHLNWDLTWPWLTLGNGFASANILVQWYEYTGVLGGSIWILLVSLFMFFLLVKDAKLFDYHNIIIALLITFFVPIFISLGIYFCKEIPKNDKQEIVVVQPNTDPYTEKFEGGSKFVSYENEQNKLIELSQISLTDSTSLLVWPETAMAHGYWEDELNRHPEISNLKVFLKRYPKLSMIAGIDSYVLYNQTNAPASARYSENIGFYDVCNTALFLTNSNNPICYHKSKLVPGVEQMPYPIIFKFLEPLAINLGGTLGTLGKQDTRTVFKTQTNLKVAPVICYESIYGEFVGEFIKNGANAIAIITNDGWWGNTPGHRQHLAYATLRAIETRKYIVRSANTGISALINPMGIIEKQSQWWVSDSVTYEIYTNPIITFYTRFGDYLGKIAIICSMVFLAFAAYSSLINPKSIFKN